MECVRNDSCTRVGTWILGRSDEHGDVHKKLMSNQGSWFQDPSRSMEW
jgi:hypothetical protein